MDEVQLVRRRSVRLAIQSGSLALATAIGTAACTIEPPPTRLPTEQPIVVQIGTDWGFTGAQKSLIGEAAVRLTSQSRGWLSVEMLGDFGPDFHVPMGAWRVLATPEMSRLVEVMDREKRGRVLGWTNRITQDIHLVPDRTCDDRTFLHVAMHELAHAAGAEHVDDDEALMCPATDPESAVAVGTADAVEIWRAATAHERRP